MTFFFFNRDPQRWTPGWCVKDYIDRKWLMTKCPHVSHPKCIMEWQEIKHLNLNTRTLPQLQFVIPHAPALYSSKKLKYHKCVGCSWAFSVPDIKCQKNFFYLVIYKVVLGPQHTCNYHKDHKWSLWTCVIILTDRTNCEPNRLCSPNRHVPQKGIPCHSAIWQ